MDNKAIQKQPSDKRPATPAAERHITPASGKAPSRIDALRVVHRSLSGLKDELESLARIRQKTALATEAAELSVSIALRLLRGHPASGVRASLLKNVVTALKDMIDDAGSGGSGGGESDAGATSVPPQPAGDPASTKPKKISPPSQAGPEIGS